MIWYTYFIFASERAVSRAEKKLQLEYDKQMEEKRKAAEDRFKVHKSSSVFGSILCTLDRLLCDLVPKFMSAERFRVQTI